MAVVKGIKEKVHLPLYDAKAFDELDKDNKPVPIKTQIAKNGNVIKFFINIQNKTKLETNQQEAGVLSHYNTYEARTLRVVIEPPDVNDSCDTTTQTAKKPTNVRSAAETACECDAFISRFIYNSVTSFIVGEKVMIQAPTWFFPSGAGPSNLNGITHGTPSPEATFRFAEPVHISHQQNFRVEIEFPRGTDALPDDALGTSRVWVVVDGYLTRDVQ